MRKSLSSNHGLRRRFRPQLECLEDRSVPATFFVNTTLDEVEPFGKLSLREAITAANNRPGDDVIVLPAGVFNISRDGANELANDTGDFNIGDSLRIIGAGRNLTFIDGQQKDRVFRVIAADETVILERMTVRNGAVNGSGGGIEIEESNLIVRDAIVSGNRATGLGGGIAGFLFDGPEPQINLVRSIVARNTAGSDAGGIFTSTSLITIRDSSVLRNTATGSGGGILTNDTATLINSTVSGNSAGGSGGGIRATTANLIKSTVSGNSASSVGGGIRATTATLTSSTISNNFAGGNGGGLFVNTATLTTSSVGGNTSGSSGGGISAGTATLIRTTVNGNRAAVIGGGINAQTANLANSTVSGNFAGGDAGGINGTANLTNSTVSGNTAGGVGGGIKAGTVKLTNSTVSGNTAGSDAGGILATETATLTNCTVSGNAASSGGGGIYADTATLTNCTVSGNTAGVVGGGISARTAILTNCTIVENLATTGGGLFYITFGEFRLKNSIVALNLVRFGGSGPDVSGAFTSEGHNLIGDGTGGTGFTDEVNGDIVGTSLNPVDPKLGPLANNGGPTKTHALLPGSPAIDRAIPDVLTTLSTAIDSTTTILPVSNTAAFVPGMLLRLGSELVVVVAVNSGNSTLTVRRGVAGIRTAHAVGIGLFLATDQRGFARQKDGNGDRKSLIDIGAFER
jgi:parallel beta-helix repeat protein/predicted outer membrane repeat protein